MRKSATSTSPDQNAVTQKARDDATSTRQLAEAAVAAAQAQVQTAQLNLDYTKVTAPVGGITSLEQVSEGSLIGTTGDTRPADEHHSA